MESNYNKNRWNTFDTVCSISVPLREATTTVQYSADPPLLGKARPHFALTWLDLINQNELEATFRIRINPWGIEDLCIPRSCSSSLFIVDFSVNFPLVILMMLPLWVYAPERMLLFKTAVRGTERNMQTSTN